MNKSQLKKLGIIIITASVMLVLFLPIFANGTTSIAVHTWNKVYTFFVFNKSSVQESDFVLSIYTKKSYNSDELIEVFGSLEYTGIDQDIRLRHNPYNLLTFSIEDLNKSLLISTSIPDATAWTILHKNIEHTKQLQEVGYFYADVSEDGELIHDSEYYMSDVYLEKGEYIINLDSIFTTFLSDSEEEYELRINSLISVK